MYHHAILIDKHNQYMNKKNIYIYIDIQIYTHTCLWYFKWYPNPRFNPWLKS